MKAVKKYFKCSAETNDEYMMVGFIIKKGDPAEKITKCFHRLNKWGIYYDPAFVPIVECEYENDLEYCKYIFKL